VSLWSSIKKAAKAVVRLVVRVVVTVAMAVINVFDLLFGFFLKPRKNLTLHVVILSKYDPIDMSYVPLCQPTDVQPSIDQTERILRERFNVKLRPYAQDYVQILDGEVPPKALKPSWAICSARNS
jgi:hypothetical protein